ncbi:MAG: T9SS type A sorting domain-containing protein [bacterium]
MKTRLRIVLLSTVYLCSALLKPDSLQAQTRRLSFVHTADFGKIHVLGSSSIGFVRATNTGTEPVTILSGEFTGAPEFVVTVTPQFPKTLQPNNFTLWNFRYFPQTVGRQFTELKITSDAMGSPHTLTIQAEAVDTPLGPWDWRFVGRPLGNRDLHAIYVDPRDENLWYVSYNNGILITRDGGDTWEQALSGGFTHRDAMAIDPTNPDRVYAALNNKLYVSSDKGASWTLLRTFPGRDFIVSLTVNSGDGTVYVPYATGPNVNASNPGIYISEDFGVNWDFFAFGFAEDRLIPWDIVQAPNSGYLYVAIEIGDHPQPYDPPFFKSTDNGRTWEEISGVLPWHGTKLQLDPTNGDVYFLTEGSGLYKTTEKDPSWQFLSNDFWLEMLLDEHHDQRLYGGAHTFGSGEGGAFVSDDAGRTFEKIGLSDLIVSSLAVNGNGQKLYAACFGAGVFLTPVPSLSTKVPSHDQPAPSQYRLQQNYPNPFNPVTSIVFETLRPGPVKLNIFNLSGQQIAVLVDNHYPAGRFKATWDATGFASGVYFYQLQAGRFSEIKRLLLLK